MPRKDFINDSLINMSDRFKRHYDEFHNRQVSAAAENSDVETDAVSEKTAEYPRLNERVEMPVVKGAFDHTEIERERRDLEGRLLRDIAFVKAEQEMILHRKDAADEFYSVLQRELENLRGLENTPALSEGECRRRTDALRAAYFKAYGKFSAVVSAGSQAAGGVSVNPAASGENNNGSRKWVAAIVSGMIISALIIAVTLIFIFT